MWKSSWTPASPTLWFSTLYLLYLSEHITFSIETLNSLMWKLTHMEKSYFPNSWSNIFHMFERYCVVYTELAWTHTTYNLCYGTRYVLKRVRIWKVDWKAILYTKKKLLVSYQTEIVLRNLGYFADVIYFVNDSGVLQTQSMWQDTLQAHLFRKDGQSCGFRLRKAGFIFWLRHSGNVTQPLCLSLAKVLSCRAVWALYPTCHDEERNLLMKMWRYRVSKNLTDQVTFWLYAWKFCCDCLQLITI